MNRQVYSNTEFTELRKRINAEILRRGSYKWWNPLTTPAVGEDRTSPMSVPYNENAIPVDEKTYTINNPSEGSIVRTRNIEYPAHGENPGGQDPNLVGNVPDTSAAQVNVDELRNYIAGLSQIRDINLFYGMEEVDRTAFRDANGIEEVLSAAEKDRRNALLHLSDNSYKKIDPHTGKEVSYFYEKDKFVMPSGE